MSIATGGRTLHIGCGPTSKRGDVGIDVLPGPAVDIVHDLDEFPWPVEDNSFRVVICEDVLEHLRDIPRVMEEIYRVSVDGGVIEIKVPSGTSSDVFIDPTHLRGFSFRSFDYFDPSKAYYAYGYSKIALHLEQWEFLPQPGRVMGAIDRVIAKLANKRPAFYEDRLSHIYPMRALRVRLSVSKPMVDRGPDQVRGRDTG
jgi:SAM-dependent methyltransferase